MTKKLLIEREVVFVFSQRILEDRMMVFFGLLADWFLPFAIDWS